MSSLFLTLLNNDNAYSEFLPPFPEPLTVTVVSPPDIIANFFFFFFKIFSACFIATLRDSPLILSPKLTVVILFFF